MFEQYAQRMVPDALRAGFEQMGDPGQAPEWFGPTLTALVLLLLGVGALILKSKSR